jgi:hypothetical protein
MTSAPVGPGMKNDVRALEIYKNVLIAGGAFTAAGATAAAYVAAWTRISYVCGDANGDQMINIGDAVFLVSYLFREGQTPVPIDAGDVNCNGAVNVSDAVYLINYVFRDGPPPCCP